MDRARFIRPLIVVWLLAGLIASSAPLRTGVAQQAATPAAAMPVGGEPPLLDLAWIAVAPTDLFEPGYGVASAETGVRPLMAFSQEQFEAAASQARFRVTATRAGYRQGYLATLEQPVSGSADRVGRRVFCALAQFRDDAGARLAYGAMTDMRREAGDIAVQAALPLEEPAVAYRFSGTTSRYQGLRIVVQSGDVVATLALVDYENASPSLSDVARLAGVVTKRIAADRQCGAPRLGFALQRLDGDGVIVEDDRYLRRDGNQQPTAGESAAAFADLSSLLSASGITDDYACTETWTDSAAIGEVAYVITVDRFRDEATAKRYFAGGKAWSDTPPAGVHDAWPIDVPIAGVDEAATFAYAFDRSTTETEHGYLTGMRIGSRILSLSMSAVPGIARESYEDLVRRNAACLRQERCLTPLSLRQTVVGEPPATATPRPAPSPTAAPRPTSSPAAAVATAVAPTAQPATRTAVPVDRSVQAAIPAVVKIGIAVEFDDGQIKRTNVVPVGSGTIVSADGLVLTNWHVVDPLEYAPNVAMARDSFAGQGRNVTARLLDDPVRISVTDGVHPPKVTYAAIVVAQNLDLDFAVLRIVGDGDGRPLDVRQLDLPFVPLGDSGALRTGDPIDLLGYPSIAGGGVMLTSGRVSGFYFSTTDNRVAWIMSDAISSGGSSGGSALDAAGRLVGVPSAGSRLACDPGDVNADGVVDDRDAGCIPHGGSFTWIRPIDLAKPLLDQARGAKTASATGTATGTATATFTITVRDIYFDPKELTIPANTDVTIELPNAGAAPHNFSIDALKISVDLAPGETDKEITLNVPAGVYQFTCNVPGHKEAGMTGTLTVR